MSTSRQSLLNPNVRDDLWVKNLRRWRLAWYLFAAFLFVGVIMIELLSNFTANFLYLFAVIGALLLVFIFADMVDSRIEVYESEKIWADAGTRGSHRASPKTDASQEDRK